MKLNRILILILLSVSPSFLFSQDFPNTKFHNDSTSSPDASLEDVEWISGYWKGEAFGGIIEEVWSPPLGNSMMCAFKLVVDGKVDFYELITISEEENTLILRMKHFHGNLEGWEEKDETLDFELVEVTPDKVFFNGFTFEKAGEDGLNVYVVFNNDGERSEMKFHYDRAKM